MAERHLIKQDPNKLGTHKAHRSAVGVVEDTIYIQIPHQFSNSVNGDYKQHSHSKQKTFPQYMAVILGIRIGHRNLG
jgi:hypothetical protein